MNRVDLAGRHCLEKQEAVDRLLEFRGYCRGYVPQHTVAGQVDVKVLAPIPWCCPQDQIGADNSRAGSPLITFYLHPFTSSRLAAILVNSSTITKTERMYIKSGTRKYQ